MTTKYKKNQEKANNSPSYCCAAIKNQIEITLIEQKHTSEKTNFGSNTHFSF